MKLGRNLLVLAALIGIIFFTDPAVVAQTQLNLLNGLPHRVPTMAAARTPSI